VKIDKGSVSQPRRARRQIFHPSRGGQGRSTHTPAQGQAFSSPPRAQVDQEAFQPLSDHSRRRSPQILPPTSPVVFITLLVLAFGAGVLITRLSTFSAPVSSISLSPVPATPIPPVPSPPPTATATSLDGGDVLETLYVEVMPADWNKIVAKRDEALQLGILLATGGDYVPATIHLDERVIPVELRLKGDWSDHFAHDKWSLRVRTVGDNDLWGMRVFSLQDPSTRSFLNEWLFLENLLREDLLAVRYRFVRVVLNGEYKGIYALEEGFAKELLEAQQRREGLIIRYGEDLVWEYRALYDDQIIPRGVNQFHIIDDFQSGRIEVSPALSAQRDTAIGLLRALWSGERTAATVFDQDAMGKSLALTDLWSADHGLIWHNLRYYYNPITARLEPIAFDSHALVGQLDTAGLPSSAFYDDPYLQAAYVQALSQFVQPGYVEALEAEFGAQFEALRAALEPEFGPDVLTPPWDSLRQRQDLLRQTLNPYQTVYAYLQQSLPESLTLIDVGNLLDLPLEIIGFEFNGTLLPANRDWLDPESADLTVPAPAEDSDALILRALAPEAKSMPYVHLQVAQSALPLSQTGDLRIVTRLWGLKEQHTDAVLPGYASPLADGPLPELPDVAQALDQHSYLRQLSEQKMLSIDSGTWEVNGNLVLPAGYGLRLAPGTTLRFGPNNYLLANGPLDFQGTDEAPIRLQPLADEWKGVVVLAADAASVWDYVTVERVSALDQDGWSLTGGITFYKSPLRLKHSRILDSRAEDSLNVIHTWFAFAYSEVASSVSDAIDVDFGQGTIQDCSFHDIGGDGIDVSGSEVQVLRTNLLNVADKGISVGETSQLAARDVHFENVGFGMVSKDLSHATLDRATVVNAQIAGLAAYVKKPIYGPASLQANDIHFASMPPERYTLVQTGSWIELEGRRLPGTDIDVDTLYQQ
jgi:hypothetical protein